MDDRQPVEPSPEGSDSAPFTADQPIGAPAMPDAERLPDGNYVGEDNIREGKVGGVIGGPHQQGGEGQGG